MDDRWPFREMFFCFLAGLFFTLLMFVLFVFVFGCNQDAIAKDESYSADEYERKQESIRKDEPRIIPDAPVRVERYSPPDYKNDPQVLISSPRAISMREVEETIVYVDRPVYVVEKPEEEVKVTATWEDE